MLESQGEAGRGELLGGPERSGGPPSNSKAETEVPAQARRRIFAAEYKLKVLGEADACREHGEIGALLRREGLYSSHLTAWRKQRDKGVLRGLKPKKRGRKSKKDPILDENRQLRRKVQRLEQRLEKAEIIIDFQKKLAEILGAPIETPPELDEIE